MDGLTEKDIKIEIEEIPAVKLEPPGTYSDHQDSASEELKEDEHIFVEAVSIKRKILGCSRCPLKFAAASDLANHVRVHTGERPFKCNEPDCDKTFKVKSRLNAHVKIVHAEEKPHVCSECNKVFLTAHRLAVHFNFHTGVKPHKCPQCDKTFTVRGTMARHIKRHHTSSLTCEKCNKIFSHRKVLIEHINIVHKRIQDMFRCLVCDAEFATSYNLTLHSKVHVVDCQLICEFCERPFAHKRHILAHLKAIHMNKDDPYECCFCTDGFVSKEELVAHEIGEHANIISVCSNCSETFESITEYRLHARAHRKFLFTYKCRICKHECNSRDKIADHINEHIGATPHKCSVCPKTFSSKHLLETHYRSHPKMEPTKQCKLCGKMCRYNADLVAHMRVHTGERPFKCDKCPQTFKEKNNLVRHATVHSDEKGVACEECGKTFKVKASLARHQWTHKEVKKYQCQFCPKSFAKRYKLEIHTRTHTGERPFVCDTCGMKFKCKDDLKNHEWTHKGGQKPYNCNVCQKGFMRKAFLTKHECSGSSEPNTNSLIVDRIDAEAEIDKLIKMSASPKTEPKSPSATEDFFNDDFSEPPNNAFKTPKEEKPQFFCEVSTCRMFFPNFQTLAAHSQYVHNTYSHVCTICSLSFENSDKFDEHFLLTHPINMKKKKFATKQKFGKSGLSYFECHYCGCHYTRRTKLVMHMERHHVIEKSSGILQKHETSPKSRVIHSIDVEKGSAPHKMKVEPTILEFSLPDTDDFFYDDFTVQPTVDEYKKPKEEKPQFFCEESTCRMFFPNLQILMAHSQYVHNTSSHICNVCFLTFENAKKLKEHLTIEHEMDMDTKKNVTNKLHKFSRLSLSYFECHYCGCNYTRKTKLMIHMERHHVIKDRPEYKCAECGKQCAYEGAYITHMRMHMGERPYSCPICNKSFRYSKGLKTHEAMHNDEKPHVCDICGEEFKMAKSLTVHKRKHSEQYVRKRLNRVHRKAKNYICEACGKELDSRAAHVIHMRKHTGEKPFSCTICQQSFQTERNLVRHASVHSEAKSFSCDICQKSYKTQSSLHRHSWTHKDKRPHQCLYCEKSFGKRYLWLKHTRIHTGEKPFECETCGWQFKDKESLKNHEWTHTNGKKPYNCTICKKGFMRKAFLNRHTCSGFV